MRRKDAIILWPIYFDSLRTRREGRRLAKKLCVPSPSVAILEKAVKNLGLNYEISPEAAHPRFPWIKMGFIILGKDRKRKGQILREIASEVVKLSA